MRRSGAGNGWRLVEVGGKFEVHRPDGSPVPDPFGGGYPALFATRSDALRAMPNPYESAEDSRKLVAWLAKSEKADQFNDELARIVGPTPLQALLTPLPVIADAAWRATQPK